MYSSHDYITLGSTPSDELCAQVGSDDYYELSRIECLVFKRMLERKFPIFTSLQNDCYYKTKCFEHDFGTYREVCIFYAEDNDKALNFALKIEAKIPLRWDRQAKKDLTEKMAQYGKVA